MGCVVPKRYAKPGVPPCLTPFAEEGGEITLKVFLACTTILFWGNIALAQVGASRTPQPKTEELVTEALHQAIALEKLPDVEFVLKGQSILAMVRTWRGDSTHGRYEVEKEALPSHVENWKIVEVDSVSLSEMAESQDVNFLSIYLESKKDTYEVDVICDMKLEKGSDKMIIDRGRLSMVFSYREGVCILLRLVRWFG
jgi:hypothetical protein